MKPPGGDWTALIVLAIVGGVALTGLGFLGAHPNRDTDSNAHPHAHPDAHPDTGGGIAISSVTSPTIQGRSRWWHPARTRAWHVYASPTQVASYYTNGASQLVVMADAADGTLYEAKPDS